MSEGKDDTNVPVPPDPASSSSSSIAQPDAPPVDTSEASSAPSIDESTSSSAPAASEPSNGSRASSTFDHLNTPDERNALLERARHFLASPQIQQQDEAGKRRFLAEKGLRTEEVDTILRETTSLQPQTAQTQRLLPPPRAYPQPPPSNLPGMLLGAMRALSWLAGGSAVLIFIYYRFFLPRILRTATARRGLVTHQRLLMNRFTASLKAAKDTVMEDLEDLPRPDPNVEPVQWRECHTVKAALQAAEVEGVEVGEIPAVTLLRCALEELKGAGKENALPSTEDVFRVLEGRIPWLLSDEGVVREGVLWDTLSTSPLFASEMDGLQEIQRWRYVNPEVPPTPPLLDSLQGLSRTMAKFPAQNEDRPSQRTLQALGDFTGYLSSQVYAPFRPTGMQYGTGSSGLGPLEEEIRKEIRALKGLVLNRRSFLPSVPR